MTKKTQKSKKKFSLFTKGSVDYTIWITVMILVAFGLIMVLSASAPSALAEKEGDSYKYVRKQAISAVLGLCAMYACSKVDYHIFRKFKWIIYTVCIVFLVAVGLVGTGANRRETLDYYCRF